MNVIANGSWFERLGAFSGVVAWILFSAAVDLMDPSRGDLIADPSLSSEQIARAYLANRASGRLGAQLSLVASVLVLWFVSYLYARLRRAEGSPRWSSALVLAGGVVLVATSLLETGFAYAASELDAGDPHPVIARFIALWTWNSASLLAPGSAAVLIGSTFNGFRYGGIPRPLAIFGAAILVLALGVGIGLGAPGFAAVLSSFWTLAAAVTLSWIEIRSPHRSEVDAAG